MIDLDNPRALALLPAVPSVGSGANILAGFRALNTGNHEMAFALWKTEAERGDREAIFLLGTSLAGKQPAKLDDMLMAFMLLSKAVAQSHAYAAFNAAILGLRRTSQGDGLPIPPHMIAALLELVVSSSETDLDLMRRCHGALAFMFRSGPPPLAGSPWVVHEVIRGAWDDIAAFRRPTNKDWG